MDKLFDIVSIVKTAGYAGIFSIVFAETGLLIGFFLPGDSLLFTAGFLASQGFLRIDILIIGSCLMAVLGDSTGYAIGKRIGQRIFTKKDSFWFKREYIERTHAFYERHGGKTLVIARFMPIVRTFAPMLAGVGLMRYASFFIFNVVGGVVWGIGIPLAGYYLGMLIPNVDRYLLPIVILIVLLSVSPSFIHVIKDREQRTKLINFLKRRLRRRSDAGYRKSPNNDVGA